MPCTRAKIPWDGDAIGTGEIVTVEGFNHQQALIGTMRKELEELTQMLCEACSLTSENMFSGELSNWWSCHKKHDEERMRDVINNFFRENKFNKQQIQYLYDYIFSEYL